MVDDTLLHEFNTKTMMIVVAITIVVMLLMLMMTMLLLMMMINTNSAFRECRPIQASSAMREMLLLRRDLHDIDPVLVQRHILPHINSRI